MENNLEKKPETIQSLVKSMNVKERFESMLGTRANAFLSSLISVTTSNKMLATATPNSILMAGAMAATLDLPINPSLGYAYIIPYNNRTANGFEVQASFQLGYKGFIQLAQRSGQFKLINVTDVRDGEIITNDRLTGEISFNWLDNREDKNIIGYVAYFELLNGFKKMFYMSKESAKKHGLKFSKTYSNEKTKKMSLWETDFDVMAQKTVLKLLLSKYAPLSIEMQKAIITDHSVIKDTDTLDVDYIDNKTISIQETVENKEFERVKNHIENSKTIEDLKQVEKLAFEHQLTLEYDMKISQLNG